MSNPASQSEIGIEGVIAGILVDSTGSPLLGTSSATSGSNPANQTAVGFRGAVSILAVDAAGTPIDFTEFGVQFDDTPLQSQLDALLFDQDVLEDNQDALRLRVASLEIANAEMDADIARLLLDGMTRTQDIAEVENRVLDNEMDIAQLATDLSSITLTADDAIALAEGLDTIARDAEQAASGNPGATTTFVSFIPSTTFSPNTIVTSLADNNNMFVNGVFVGGLNRGQTHEFDASQGDVITSARGHSGVYNLNGDTERPVELASAANAGTQFLWFSFRSNNHRHVIQTLALPARVQVFGPNPTVDLDGTSPDTPIQDVELAPNEVLDFNTSVNGEYYVLASQPVVVSTSNQNGNQDQRALAPLGNRLIGGVAGVEGGDAGVSALYPNTTVTVRTSTGFVGTGIASPGAPLSLHGNNGSPINLPRVRSYGNGHGVLIEADGPISGFAGADEAGTNATTHQLLGSVSQVVGLSLGILGEGSQRDGVSFSSPFEGTVSIYQRDGTLVGTRQLLRRGTLSSPAVTPEEQRHPADATFRGNDADYVDLQRGAYLVSDVPINVVANFNEGNGSRADDDDTAAVGISPPELAPLIRRAADGLLYRTVLGIGGVETTVPA